MKIQTVVKCGGYSVRACNKETVVRVLVGSAPRQMKGEWGFGICGELDIQNGAEYLWSL